MREIKFRAWDGKRMLFCTKGGYYDFIIEGGEIALFGEFDLRDRKTPEWPLMQYTGLKDKNGADIYEDDVVHRADGYIGEVSYGRVLFEGTGQAYVGFYLRKNDNDYTHIDGSLEVLGNIHQHPELLK